MSKLLTIIKILNIFLVLFLLLVTFSFPIYAQENWVINNFSSDINILSSGRVQIVETIDVDFGNLQKHGIFRDIPYVYTSSGGEKTYTEIDVLRVTDGLNTIPYETSKTESFVRIKIGDPDKLITGTQNYTISYTATGVLTSFEDHDELFWNVTGNSWPVPITQASTTVALPAGGITKITCFEGVAGSRTNCSSTQNSQISATFKSTRPLGANEGLTVVVGYTKGLVPIIAVSPPKDQVDKLLNTPSLLVVLIIPFLGIVIPLILWWKKGRDYWWRRRYLGDTDAKHEVKPIGAHETVVVEYSPPENLRPAEIGTLVDEKAHTTDVTATIIDLASRGFLKIKEIEKKWIFGSTDYEFTRLRKDNGELVNYEKELLDRIFDDGDVVKMSDLKKEFYKDLKKVKEELYIEMVNKKFFYENPESVRKKYRTVGVIILVLGTIMLILGANMSLLILIPFGVGIALAGVFTTIFSNFMPRKTAYGREMYRRVRGYHLFVTRAEKYRQQFFERKNMFNEVLPYAIVFGVTEKFAKAFAAMGMEPQQPSWYVGSRPFSAAAFGASMSSFSSSLSSAMAAAPGGSGFSSGGGFSGGGFGGGGGGSW